MIKNLITIFKNPDLRKRMLNVLGLLLVFRLLTIIPMPGVSPANLKTFLQSNQIFGYLIFLPVELFPKCP